MKISTGAATPHDTSGAVGNVLHGYDPGESPATVAPTRIYPATPGTAATGPDFVGPDAVTPVLAADEAAITAAKSSGEADENGRRQGYEADITPIGAMYGDQLDLPDVPSAAFPSPLTEDPYGKSVDEPGPWSS